MSHRITIPRNRGYWYWQVTCSCGYAQTHFISWVAREVCRYHNQHCGIATLRDRWQPTSPEHQ